MQLEQLLTLSMSHIPGNIQWLNIYQPNPGLDLCHEFKPSDSIYKFWANFSLSWDHFSKEDEKHKGVLKDNTYVQTPVI